MNTDVIQGKWKQMTGSVKQFFGKLTDDDLQQVDGNSEKILGKLQERYGYTREQAETEWKKFSGQNKEWFGDTKDDMKNTARDKKNDVDNSARDMKNTDKR